jgi:two-component system, cell cycle response regulator
MKREELLEAILNSSELPTLPSVAAKLISLTAKPEATLIDIAGLISQDVSLSSKVLKVANSSLYSLINPVGSIRQAVSILGINAVRSLILSFSFLNMKDGKTYGNFDFESFWEQSLASGVALKLILDKTKEGASDDVFLAGLLQNLGELILIRTFPDDFEKILGDAASDTEQLQLEIDRLGATHAYVGYAVARSWGFPDSLLLPILYHHTPDECPADCATSKQIINATYLSHLLIQILYSETPEKYHSRFRDAADRLMNFHAPQIEEILNEIPEKVDETGKYFGLEIHNTKTIKEILQEANIRLSIMNLNYEQMNKQLIQAKLELEALTEELQAKNRLLDNLVNVDGLTGVFNHRYFQNYLINEIGKAKRHQRPISLLMFDIDNFKKFNDTYGHQVGDFVLIRFCEVLQNNLRHYDMLARYGGEEFVIVLPETETLDAMIVGEKLRAAIDEAVFIDQGSSYHVTTSIGHAIGYPHEDPNVCSESLIRDADLALLDAKHAGKNRVITFEPVLDENGQELIGNPLKRYIASLRNNAASTQSKR